MLVRVTPHMVWYGLVWYGMAWYGLGPRLGDAPLGHEQELVVVDDGVEPVRDGQDRRACLGRSGPAFGYLSLLMPPPLGVRGRAYFWPISGHFFGQCSA